MDSSSVPVPVSVSVPAPVSVSKPAWNTWVEEAGTRSPHPHPHTPVYYIKCMMGGVLGCGLTHTAVVGVDVAKCKMQVYPHKYTGFFQSLKTILAEEGAGGLVLGWAPTLIGYSMQGLCKFGFYEVFKDVYGNMLGEDVMATNKGLVWVGASASAELIADVALCPLEMIKVKVQTSPAGTWPTKLKPAACKMYQNRAETRFPFGSVGPLWGRQIPYTVAKFYFFEKIVQSFYDNIFTAPKDSYNKSTQLGITFTSGYLAGVICALVSHPADNIVSQLGKSENRGKKISSIASEFGMMNLFTKGLGARVFMVGTLTGLQWWIYDTFKTAMGMGTTGGGSVKK